MTDEEPVRRFAAAIELGNPYTVRTCFRVRMGRSVSSSGTESLRLDALDAIDALRPWLCGGRLNQIDAALRFE